jgi:Ras-related protein Rab-1A
MIDSAQVDSETAQTFGDSLKMPYVETSALNSHQVELAFATITRQLMQTKAQPQQKGNKLSAARRSKSQNCCGK